MLPPLSRLIPFLALCALFVLPFAVPFVASTVGEASWDAGLAATEQSLLEKGLVPACGTKSLPVSAEGGDTTVTYTPCSTCHFVQLIKNVLDFVVKYVTLAGVALMLMVGGFQMVAGGLGGSAAAHQKGIHTIKNAFIGLAIVLFAWLAIDTIIKFIAGRGSVLSTTPAELPKRVDGGLQEGPLGVIAPPSIEYGPWNEIKCTELGPVSVTSLPPKKPAPIPDPGSVTGEQPPLTGTGALCSFLNNACSPQALEDMGYTSAQAKAMSCIAMTESGGVPALVNPTGGACGTFQILPSNWNNPKLHRGSCSTATDCRDVGCNMQMAFLLSAARIARGTSPYSDWTCPGCNRKAQDCVNRYDPGWAVGP